MEKDNWQEYKARGNMAENAVHFLISSMHGWKCHKFGMENHIEEIRKTLRDKQDEISRKVRTMPDLMAINSTTGEVLLFDVKYRSFIDRRDPKTALYGFDYAQMRDYLQFWPEALLVVATNYEPYFTVISLKDIEWHKHFHSRTNGNGTLYEQWNLAGIQKSIKDVFPNLPEEIIQKARNMLPRKINLDPRD